MLTLDGESCVIVVPIAAPVHFFSLSLGLMLTNANVKISRHRNQLVEAHDRVSSVNQLVFDLGGEMFIKAILEVRGRVTRTCYQFFKQGCILRDHGCH